MTKTEDLSPDDMIFLSKLGERITTLRKAKGLSHAQLAEVLSTSKTQIFRIEKGESNTGIVTLNRMARVFDTSIYELVKF